MSQVNNFPRVGVGVLVIKNDKILIGKRISKTHGTNTWSPPGGWLEYGEGFEECAAREVKEETGIEIKEPKVVGITNNIFPDGFHTLTVWVIAKWKRGEAKVMEPEKFQEWKWLKIDELKNLKPLFLPLKLFLENKTLLNHLLKELNSSSLK